VIHTPESAAQRWANWGMEGPPEPSVWRSPVAGAGNLMGDLHGGNIGPGGQIIDFAAPAEGLGWAKSTATRVHTSPWNLTADIIPGGRDQLANLEAPTAAQQAMNRQINNGIRRFYDKLTPAQRQVALDDPIEVPQRWTPPAGGAGEFEQQLGAQAARQGHGIGTSTRRLFDEDWERKVQMARAAAKPHPLGPPLKGIMHKKRPPVPLAPTEASPRKMNTSEFGPQGPQAPFSAWSAGPQARPRQRIWPWMAAGGAAAGGGGLLREYLRSQGNR
jgi:hypothetical protein